MTVARSTCSMQSLHLHARPSHRLCRTHSWPQAPRPSLASFWWKTSSPSTRKRAFAGTLQHPTKRSSRLWDTSTIDVAGPVRRELDGLPWLTSLSRRVQHYGHVFDYVRRAVDFEQPCRPLPPAVQAIADRALAQGLVASAIDQCTINEYLPGQVSHACLPSFQI